LGLRRLQSREYLQDLLTELVSSRDASSGRLGRAVPLLVKLAPDLTSDELDDALEVILDAGLDGVVATNSTTERIGLHSPQASEAGGLSGRPLSERSTEMIRRIHERTGGRLPIIGVGGIASADDARAKLDAGAVLVQIYTGLVYEGPAIVKRILRGLWSSA
jgi:dihydroorotate dehydrogenase